MKSRTSTSVDDVFSGMLRPKRGLHYYQMRLSATREGVIQHSTCTEWVGFTETRPRREIRAASIVNPKWWIRTWIELGVPYVIVNTLPQLFVYRMVGGDALIERELAERFFPDVIRASEVARDAPTGYRTLSTVPKSSLCRAPSRKLRMFVLQRDGYRCRICGRRPVDYVDVELDVHHIRPWASGALTEAANLITLCQTCHTGLSPHENSELFRLLPHTVGQNDYAAELVASSQRYRDIIEPIHARQLKRSKRQTSGRH